MEKYIKDKVSEDCFVNDDKNSTIASEPVFLQPELLDANFRKNDDSGGPQ